MVATWFTYSKVMQARRTASYRAALAPLQRDLHLGMDRCDVKKYLDARKLSYNAVRYDGSDSDTYQIEIGEEPGSLVCDPWKAYIALEFTAADKLREIHTKKDGTCL